MLFTMMNSKEPTSRLPKHIAIIMDGNGRWAASRGLPRIMGHKAGVQTIKRVIKACAELDIPVLSLYAFSTENWKRPREDVASLMQLFEIALKAEIAEMHANNLRLKISGDTTRLPESLQAELAKSIELTKDNTGLVVNFALDYGSRAEILRATSQIVESVCSGEFQLADLSEHIFEKFLYTCGLPDPDLLIRTSGEIRLSNFLLWQSAYTELWFTKVYWPDFTREHLLEAIRDYQSRKRKFGKLLCQKSSHKG